MKVIIVLMANHVWYPFAGYWKIYKILLTNWITLTLAWVQVVINKWKQENRLVYAPRLLLENKQFFRAGEGSKRGSKSSGKIKLIKIISLKEKIQGKWIKDVLLSHDDKLMHIVHVARVTIQILGFICWITFHIVRFCL